MIYFAVLVLIFYNVTFSDAVTVSIKGVIDLGPQWNYYYRVFSSNNSKADIGPTLKQVAKVVNSNLFDDAISVRHPQYEYIKPLEGTTEKPKTFQKNYGSVNSEEAVKKRPKTGSQENNSEEIRDISNSPTEKSKHDKSRQFTSSEHHVQKSERLKNKKKPLKSRNQQIELNNPEEPISAKQSQSLDQTSDEFGKDLTDNRNKDLIEPLRDIFHNLDKKNRPDVNVEKSLSDPVRDIVSTEIARDDPIPLTNNKNPDTFLKKTPLNDSSLIQKIPNMDIYNEPIEIKSNDNIKNFMIHIYNQTQNIFETMRSRSEDDYEMKRQIHFLSKSYHDKFNEFMKDTLKQHIRTKLGSQKVMLNTIDVSKRILNRLVNFIKSDMDKRGILRDSSATNVFIKEIDKHTDDEYAYVCKQFGICRTSMGLSEYVSLLIVELLKVDDTKLMFAINSFTEVLKDTDLSKTFDKETLLKLNVTIKKAEKADVKTIRALLFMANNILLSKNRPFVIKHRVQPRVKLTVAILELMDTMENASLFKERNKIGNQTWEKNNFLDNLKSWVAGYTTNMITVMEKAVKQINAFLQSIDKDSRIAIKELVNKILGYIVHEDQMVEKGYTRN